jgi:hypothetical protein
VIIPENLEVAPVQAPNLFFTNKRNGPVSFLRQFPDVSHVVDRLGGLVVRVSGYRYRGPGFDSRRYQIF